MERELYPPVPVSYRHRLASARTPNSSIGDCVARASISDGESGGFAYASGHRAGQAQEVRLVEGVECPENLVSELDLLLAPADGRKLKVEQ